MEVGGLLGRSLRVRPAVTESAPVYCGNEDEVQGEGLKCLDAMKKSRRCAVREQTAVGLPTECNWAWSVNGSGLSYWRIQGVFWERKTGFEPATFSLARRCSTTEPLPRTLVWERGRIVVLTPRSVKADQPAASRHRDSFQPSQEGVHT